MYDSNAGTAGQRAFRRLPADEQTRLIRESGGTRDQFIRALIYVDDPKDIPAVRDFIRQLFR